MPTIEKFSVIDSGKNTLGSFTIEFKAARVRRRLESWGVASTSLPHALSQAIRFEYYTPEGGPFEGFMLNLEWRLNNKGVTGFDELSICRDGCPMFPQSGTPAL